MNRISLQVRSVLAAERIAERAIQAGCCRNRREYQAVRRVYRASTRYAGGWNSQRAQDAYAALPKEGPGAVAYFLAVTCPAIERRYRLRVKRFGEPGPGPGYNSSYD